MGYQTLLMSVLLVCTVLGFDQRYYLARQLSTRSHPQNTSLLEMRTKLFQSMCNTFNVTSDERGKIACARWREMGIIPTATNSTTSSKTTSETEGLVVSTSDLDATTTANTQTVSTAVPVFASGMGNDCSSTVTWTIIVVLLVQVVFAALGFFILLYAKTVFTNSSNGMEVPYQKISA